MLYLVVVAINEQVSVQNYAPFGSLAVPVRSSSWPALDVDGDWYALASHW